MPEDVDDELKRQITRTPLILDRYRHEEPRKRTVPCPSIPHGLDARPSSQEKYDVAASANHR